MTSQLLIGFLVQTELELLISRLDWRLEQDLLFGTTITQMFLMNIYFSQNLATFFGLFCVPPTLVRRAVCEDMTIGRVHGLPLATITRYRIDIEYTKGVRLGDEPTSQHAYIPTYIQLLLWSHGDDLDLLPWLV